jgi:hypothetical protein
VSTERRSTVDPVRAWDLVLRAYAAALEEHRSVLVAVGAGGPSLDGGALPPRFAPPLGLGPIPDVLVGRAEALLIETAGLIDVATELAGDDRPPASVATLRPGPLAVGPRRPAPDESTSTMEHRL